MSDWWRWNKKGEERRVNKDRRSPGILGWVLIILKFVFVAVPLWIGRLIRKTLKWFLISAGIIVVLLVLGILAVGFSANILDTLDRKYPDKLTELDVKDITPILSPYYFHEESEVFAADKKVACFSSPEHRLIIDKLEDVSLFERAILASEDKSFYEHNGVNGWAILRAIGGHVQHMLGLGGSRSGASTITMQLAKSLYRDKDGKDAPRTLRQKLREAVTALRIEHRLNKYQIMQRYINGPYFGRGRYGIESASRSYFGKSAKDLSLPQVAYIVALINKPALPDRVIQNDPHPEETRAYNLKLARQGAQRVLGLMEKEDVLKGFTKMQYAQASIDLEKLSILSIGSGCNANDSGRYYTEHVRVLYKDTLALNSGGYDIFVPRDDGLQEVLAKGVKTTVDTYLARHPSDPDNAELRACAYAIQFNGDVLAWVGNVDFKKYKFDACALGWRSPGSTIKPFTYGAMVQKLIEETMAKEHPPETIDAIMHEVLNDCRVLDAPIAVGLGRGKGKKWIQNFHSNSEPLYRGNISCQLALGESRNAAAMRAGQRGGIKEMIELIYRLGMPKDAKHFQQPYPTTAIGGSDVRPIGMAGVATFMNGGMKMEPRFVNDICKNGKSSLFKDEEGQARDCDPKGEHHDLSERLIAPPFAATMVELLKGPVDLPTGTVHGLRTGVIPGLDPLGPEIWKLKPEEKKKRMLAFPFEQAGEIAGKTGTATNADGRTCDVWLLLFIPGPPDHPEKGVMLVFWMGKDSKDHPLGTRGTSGGQEFAESGARNWVHSAATIVSFFQKERGLLRPGNHFQPIYRDDVLLNFEAKKAIDPKDLPANPDDVQVIDPSDPDVDPNLLKDLPPPPEEVPVEQDPGTGEEKKLPPPQEVVPD